MAHGLLSLPFKDSPLRSMNVQLSIQASLSCDLVLAHNWMFYCRNAFPNTRFVLGSGSVHIHPLPPPSSPSSDHSSMAVDHDVMAAGTPSILLCLSRLFCAWMSFDIY
ncbi:hypothetical protein FB451DRAFT_1566039 [Mycena latifolia]|nr:hypothetical protein FB451DRAFT_1566039 [Mycena latifolia]